MSLLTTTVGVWDHPINSRNGHLVFRQIRNIFARIQRPAATERRQITTLRKVFLKEGKSDSYNKLKKGVGSFHANISFSQRREQNPDMLLNGLMYLDFDLKDSFPKLSGPDLVKKANEIKQQITETPFLFAVWKSISGAGLSVVISINNLTKENFEDCFVFLTHYFLNNYKIKTDKKCRNINRACFISYDPKLYKNPEAIPLTRALSENICESMGVRLDDLIVIQEAYNQPTRTPLIPEQFRNEIYYKSVPDIHYPELLGSVNFDGRYNVTGRDGHLYFETGFLRAFVPFRKGPILQGDRLRKLITDFSSFLFLNPHLPDEVYLYFLHRRNQDLNSPPLKVDETENVLDFCIEMRDKNELSPCTRLVKSHWLSTAPAAGEEQRQLVRNLYRRNKTWLKIEAAIRRCVDQCEPVNNKKLSRMTGIRRATVIDNARFFKIQEINKYLNEFKIKNGNTYGKRILLMEYAPNHPKALFTRSGI